MSWILFSIIVLMIAIGLYFGLRGGPNLGWWGEHDFTQADCNDNDKVKEAEVAEAAKIRKKELTIIGVSIALIVLVVIGIIIYLAFKQPSAEQEGIIKNFDNMSTPAKNKFYEIGTQFAQQNE